MTAWGWRIPFLVALPLGLVGRYLRTRMEDTPVFRELASQGSVESGAKTQFAELLRYWRPVVVCMGLVLFLNITDYTLLSYMPTYLKDTVGLTASGALVMTIIVYAGMMCVINQVGRTSDRIGRKPVWAASGIGFLILSLPMFWLMSQHSWALIIIGFAVLALLLVFQLGIISATFPTLFPTQIRYAGFAISYNVSTAIFGGTAPFVNDLPMRSKVAGLRQAADRRLRLLSSAVGNDRLSMIPRTSAYWPAFYLMGAAVIGLVALWFAPETAGGSIRGTELPRLVTTRPAPMAGLPRARNVLRRPGSVWTIVAGAGPLPYVDGCLAEVLPGVMDTRSHVGRGVAHSDRHET